MTHTVLIVPPYQTAG